MRTALVAAAFVLFAGAALAQTQLDRAHEAALREVDAFTTLQARTDPHFKQAEAQVLPKVDTIVATMPPAEWLPAIRRLYFGASERLHREERELIADEERAAFTRPPADSMTWDYFVRRLLEIQKSLEAGQYGPRGQALHALEAAKLYIPDDPSFLAYRQARVPLATAYEMGRISRTEYDERWARAGEAFLARQRAEDQARAEMGERIAAEELRARQEMIRSFENQYMRPSTTCTSQVVLGRLQTVCR